MQLKLPWDTPLSVAEVRFPDLTARLMEYFADCTREEIPARIEWRDNFMTWRPRIFDRTDMADIDPAKVFAHVVDHDDTTVTLEIHPGYEDRAESLRGRAAITFNCAVSSEPRDHVVRVYKLRLGPREPALQGYTVTVKRAVASGEPNPNTGKPAISLDAKLQRWIVDFYYAGWPALVEWGHTPEVPNSQGETLMRQCAIDPRRVCGELISVDSTTATIRLRGPYGDVARKAIEDHGDRIRFFINSIGHEYGDDYQVTAIAKVYLAESVRGDGS